MSNILYETFLLNVHHAVLIKSVKTDTLLNSNTNFGVLFHDSVTNIFGLYHFCIEIYVRLFFNLIKKILSMFVESCTDRNVFMLFRK